MVLWEPENRKYVSTNAGRSGRRVQRDVWMSQRVSCCSSSSQYRVVGSSQPPVTTGPGNHTFSWPVQILHSHTYTQMPGNKTTNLENKSACKRNTLNILYWNHAMEVATERTERHKRISTSFKKICLKNEKMMVKE